MYIIQNCQLYCNKFYAFLMMQYIYDMCIGSIRCVVMGFRDLLFLCHEKHGLVKSDLPLLYQSSTIKWSCCIICHLGFVTWIHNPLIIGGLYTIIPCKLNIIMWASGAPRTKPCYIRNDSMCSRQSYKHEYAYLCNVGLPNVCIGLRSTLVHWTSPQTKSWQSGTETLEGRFADRV